MFQKSEQLQLSFSSFFWRFQHKAPGVPLENIESEGLDPSIDCMSPHCLSWICIKKNPFHWSQQFLPPSISFPCQGYINRGTCSHPELTPCHVLTSAHEVIFWAIAGNAINKSVWRKRTVLDFPSTLQQTCNEYLHLNINKCELVFLLLATLESPVS